MQVSGTGNFQTQPQNFGLLRVSRACHCKNKGGTFTWPTADVINRLSPVPRAVVYNFLAIGGIYIVIAPTISNAP